LNIYKNSKIGYHIVKDVSHTQLNKGFSKLPLLTWPKVNMDY
jgi:hypothetical protein